MISVLFAARDSVYKKIPGLDVWDEDRDALNWPGGNPGIFHPPCRLFCRLRHLSTAPESEKELAYWSVSKVRQWGGVLEHPAHSRLWDEALLPSPGHADNYGFSYDLDQYWFGHSGKKRTWLYICGLDPEHVPVHAIRLAGNYEDLFASAGRKYVPGSRHSGIRSATPLAFAQWLVEVASNVTGMPNAV
jgi:hypothetical protein